MTDKDKSLLDKFVDTFSEVMGSVAKGAVTPTEEGDPSHIAETTNEQMLIRGEGIVGPEPVHVRAARKKRRPAKRADKRAAKVLKRSSRAKKAPAAKKARTTKKAAKKVAKRPAPKKRKSSTGRKVVGRKRPTKKVAKRTAKKSKR